jgi:acyl-CoA synthetase (AMP-forming)/AMP-acid ligase II
MGKAIPNVEILVINEQGFACQPGEVGELVHRGANITLGYWRDPESSRRVLRPHPLGACRNGIPELVVFSGDLVKTDDEGYLYYVGRKDMQIKSRGVRVSPEEIELCIQASGLVSHVVGFAVPRDAGDNDLVAAVVAADSDFRPDELEAFCRNEMPEYMWPRHIWALPALPMTPSGKPDRSAIREMYVEHRQGAGAAAPVAGTA